MLADYLLLGIGVSIIIIGVILTYHFVFDLNDDDDSIELVLRAVGVSLVIGIGTIASMWSVKRAGERFETKVPVVADTTVVINNGVADTTYVYNLNSPKNKPPKE